MWVWAVVAEINARDYAFTRFSHCTLLIWANLRVRKGYTARPAKARLLICTISISKVYSTQQLRVTMEVTVVQLRLVQECLEVQSTTTMEIESSNMQSWSTRQGLCSMTWGLLLDAGDAGFLLSITMGASVGGGVGGGGLDILPEDWMRPYKIAQGGAETLSSRSNSLQQLRCSRLQVCPLLPQAVLQYPMKTHQMDYKLQWWDAW